MSGTRVYKTWNMMVQRCENPNNPNYKDYGGRGIQVCERWHELENFSADMGDPPDGLSLDRRDNEGDYERSNCRWATRKTQNRNTRRNRMLTYDGQTQCATAWANSLGMNAKTLYARLALGWTVEQALTTPVQRQRRGATFEGVTQSLADWAYTVGIKRKTLQARLDAGWSAERALTTPARAWGR